MAPKRSTAGKSGGTSIAQSLGKGTKGGAAAGAAKAAQQQASLLKGKQPLAQNTTAQPRQRVPSPSTYSKEQLTEADGRADLEIDDPKYDKLWRQVQTKMGMPKHKPIHSEGMTRIEHILRVFDLDPSYGPCLGMSRLERWQRAEKLGDEPPEEIRDILETKQGVLDYKFSVLHDKGV